MASLLFGAALLSYDALKSARAKKRQDQPPSPTTTPSFSEQEHQNAARIAALQQNTCFCQTSDWRGGGCEVHGYVPPYSEVDEEAPAYEVRGRDGDGEGRGNGDRHEEYVYVRGQEDGFLADQPGKVKAPRPMPEDEVRRINEERRKRMKAGGFTNWVLRRKEKEKGGADFTAVAAG